MLLFNSVVGMSHSYLINCSFIIFIVFFVLFRKMVELYLTLCVLLTYQLWKM